MSKGAVPVIIPAYEPDEKLIKLVSELVEEKVEPIVVVDDGSGFAEYGRIFDEARKLGAVVLRNAVNMGKGRALKHAFNHCLNEYENLVGVVTADSDGQHSVKDIKKCREVLTDNCDALVLGVRDFDGAGIPARSVFGNKTTSRVMRIFLGLKISDTQTGLRGIGAHFMRYLLTEKGERFEFEMNMLIATKERDIRIIEVPIDTIYLEENRSSHFNPLRDSLRIYAVFFEFLLSSTSSSLLDMLLFGVFCALFTRMHISVGYIMLATVFARVISATYNFLINYEVVFKGKKERSKAAVSYFALAVVIMLISGFAVTVGHSFFFMIPEICIKVPVDCLLFLLSFYVQREFVYA
ncbi:MAG: bifunctional glycosyltransferase family 2/GtrA family protein [Butyrivibrio sp.]|nr:bifunctional glycosyltransferase family 2/GtrA family protein [Butyrivibrio sp.]